MERHASCMQATRQAGHIHLWLASHDTWGSAKKWLGHNSRACTGRVCLMHPLQLPAEYHTLITRNHMTRHAGQCASVAHRAPPKQVATGRFSPSTAKGPSCCVCLPATGVQHPPFLLTPTLGTPACCSVSSQAWFTEGQYPDVAYVARNLTVDVLSCMCFKTA